ncbi:hypothetical protein DIPPA_02927 [Diplonema papillatum]|nr:hypothetical protein DIPPA_02927 [Diplonema papillatum]
MRASTARFAKVVTLDFLPWKETMRVKVKSRNDTLQDVSNQVERIDSAGTDAGVDLAQPSADEIQKKRFQLSLYDIIGKRIRVLGDECTDTETSPSRFSSLRGLNPNFSAPQLPPVHEPQAPLLSEIPTITDLQSKSSPAHAAPEGIRRPKAAVCEPSGATPHDTLTSVFSSISKVSELTGELVRFSRRYGGARTLPPRKAKARALPLWQRAPSEPLHRPAAVWMVVATERHLPLWRFDDEGFSRRARADADRLVPWVDKGSWVRLLKRTAARTRAAQRGRRRRAPAALPLWTERPLLRARRRLASAGPCPPGEREGRLREEYAEALRHADVDRLLLVAGPARILLDLTSAGSRLADGQLAAVLKALGDAPRKGAREPAYLRHVQQCYALMVRRHDAGALTHTTAVVVLARRGKLETARLLLRTLPPACKGEPRPYTSILKKAALVGMPETFLDAVWGDLRAAGVTPDGPCWAAIVRGYGNLSFAKAVQWYRRALEVEQGAGSAFAFGDWLYEWMFSVAPPDAGVAIWSEMRRRRVPRTAGTLTAWLRKCGACGDVDTALLAASVAAEDGVHDWAQVVELACALGESDAVVSNVLLVHSVAAGESLAEAQLAALLRSLCEAAPAFTAEPAHAPRLHYPLLGLLPPAARQGRPVASPAGPGCCRLAVPPSPDRAVVGRVPGQGVASNRFSQAPARVGMLQ